MNPPHGDLVLSVVSIRSSPNLDILGVKFNRMLTFEDHVRGIVSRVSQRIGILRLVKYIFVNTSVFLHCDFAFVRPTLECNPVAVLNEHLSLLVGRFVPTKIIRVRNKDKPWFDDQCMLLASSMRLIFGGPVFTLGLTGKSLSTVK